MVKTLNISGTAGVKEKLLETKTCRQVARGEIKVVSPQFYYYVSYDKSYGFSAILKMKNINNA